MAVSRLGKGSVGSPLSVKRQVDVEKIESSKGRVKEDQLALGTNW